MDTVNPKMKGRMKNWREKIKQTDEEKWQEFLRKDQIRNKLNRTKQKDKLKTNKHLLLEKRKKDRERQALYRMKKKEKMLALRETGDSPCDSKLGIYKSPCTLGNAIKKEKVSENSNLTNSSLGKVIKKEIVSDLTNSDTLNYDSDTGFLMDEDSSEVTDKDPLKLITKESVVPGVYILVRFITCKGNEFKYLAICQSEVRYDDEVTVIFMKSYGKPNQFVIDEVDERMISFEDIVSIENEPIVITVGNTVIYEFPNLLDITG